MPRMIRGATALFMLAVLFVAPACAEATKVTFLLVNDIYQMSAQVMPDGRTRGGFARLAAVVKAERRKGGHVIVAHAGDMISPSLMSGLDRGAHTIALSNLVGLDIFAPGNHEFDFGKAVFLQRMREAKFPVYAANLRGPDGQPLAGIKDRGIVSFDGVRIGLTGATYDDSARASSPEDLQFLPTVASAKGQAEALRREGADFVAAVVHADRAQDYELFGTRSVDLILSGHNHDLFVNYDERNAMAESSYDAHYLVAVDVAIEVTTRNGVRATKWWPQFRIIDTATVTPDPAVAAAVLPYEKELAREMDIALGTTAVELDSRNATVRTREAAIGNLFADAMRSSVKADAAVTNGGDLRRALENGLAQLPGAGGRFPQVSGLTIEVDPKRAAGDRIVAISVGGAPLDDARIYKVAINDFLARGGDGYVWFRDAKHVLPEGDSPLLANAVMAHVKRLGTIRNAVEGRILQR